MAIMVSVHDLISNEQLTQVFLEPLDAFDEALNPQHLQRGTISHRSLTISLLALPNGIGRGCQLAE